MNLKLPKWSVLCKKEWGWGAAERQKTGFLTCTTSIIAGVHFSEVRVDGGALGRIVGAVQTAVTDRVEIAAIWEEVKEQEIKTKESNKKNQDQDAQ